MSLKVTATAGGSTANGLLLRVFVLTGAAPAEAQKGATVSHQFPGTGTWTQSITTTQSGSRVYGAATPGEAGITVNPAALTTVVDDVNDATNGETYVTFKATSLTGTPGATTLGLALTGATPAGPFAMAEILCSGVLAEDASAPAVVSTLAATTISTANFSPPPGSLLVALVPCDGAASTVTMTVSGGLLNWTQLVANNPSGGDYAGVWIAQVPAANEWNAPIRAKLPRASLKGRISFTTLVKAAVTGGTGPVFNPAVQAIRAKLPQQPAGIGAFQGRVSSNSGAPVQNPQSGPAFFPKTFPAKGKLPLPPRGRVYATAKPFIAATTTITPFFQANQVLRAKLPQQPFLRGRVSSNAGAPLRNPQSGPAFRQKTYPVQAQDPLPKRGRVYSNPGVIPAKISPVTPVIPLTVVRAKLPLSRRGICRAIRFYPLGTNPQPGPVFRQATQPIRIRPSLPPRGRVIIGSPGAPVNNPVIQTGPCPILDESGNVITDEFGSWVLSEGCHPPAAQPSPVQAKGIGLPPRGRVYSNPGAAVHNPQSGPVFTPKPYPVQAQYDVLPRRGRTYASVLVRASGITSGPPFYPKPYPVQAQDPLPRRGRVYGISKGAVNNPQSGPVFFPAVHPIRAVIPQTFSKGRIESSPGAPLQNPNPGPVFRQATSPAKAKLPKQFFPKGKNSSNPGGPVTVGGNGPVFLQKTFPARARIPKNAPRGRISFNAGTLHNPQSGPVFIQAVRPAQARIPQVFSKGRVYSNPGGPVVNPVFSPPVYPLKSPVRAHPVPPPRGRISSNAGIPVPHVAPVYPLQHPVAAKLPVPFLKGRVSSNPGIIQVYAGPRVYPLGHPVRAQFPLPPRGRVYSNPGTLPPVVVTPARIYPLKGPVQARRPLPPKGRVILGNKGAPLHNPQQGPVFRQAVKPIRATIPQNAPRGRTSGNHGGPVANPSANRAAVWHVGQTYTRWNASFPYSRWQLGTPYTRESTN
jgi:hypothetical protein